MNNIANLLPVVLDSPDVLQAQWEEQWQLLQDRKDLQARNYTDISEFTDYFQQLFTNILTAINLPYQRFIVQHHDYQHNNNKMSYVSQMHFDTERKCCITIPIFSQEPICFYNDVAAEDFNSNRTLGKYKKPTQVCRYSSKHPSLVNVQNVHNVFITDVELPRVLLQISYDFTFDEIVKGNPSIFKVL